MQPHVPAQNVDVIEHWFKVKDVQHYLRAEREDYMWIVSMTSFSAEGVPVSQHYSASLDEYGMAHAMRTLMESAGVTLTH